MTTKKNKLIYKIITIATLVAPLTIYLFLSATLFNINPDIIAKNIDSNELIIVEDFAYTTNTDVIYNGSIVYEQNTYGFYIDETTIIKTDDGYFSYVDNELTNIRALEIQKETSYRLPLAFVVSVLGIGIVLMVVNKKMEWYKQYPRIFVLVSLITGTLTLLMLDVIVSNLLSVFLVATISWALYCVEYMVNQGMLDEKDAKKSESSLIDSLKKALGE